MQNPLALVARVIATVAMDVVARAMAMTTVAMVMARVAMVEVMARGLDPLRLRSLEPLSPRGPEA